MAIVALGVFERMWQQPLADCDEKRSKGGPSEACYPPSFSRRAQPSCRQEAGCGLV